MLESPTGVTIACLLFRQGAVDAVVSSTMPGSPGRSGEAHESESTDHREARSKGREQRRRVGGEGEVGTIGYNVPVAKSRTALRPQGSLHDRLAVGHIPAS